MLINQPFDGDKWKLKEFVDDVTTAFELVNPLPVQFKALLHGQKGCVFFSGHLNL